MSRIERDSDQAHPLPGRRDGESGGASLVTPCGNVDRSVDADRPKRAARVKIDRIYDPDEVRSCTVSGEESADRSDAADEGGAG
jgi:hypothetical protein